MTVPDRPYLALPPSSLGPPRKAAPDPPSGPVSYSGLPGCLFAELDRIFCLVAKLGRNFVTSSNALTRSRRFHGNFTSSSTRIRSASPSRWARPVSRSWASDRASPNRRRTGSCGGPARSARYAARAEARAEALGYRHQEEREGHDPEQVGRREPEAVGVEPVARRDEEGDVGEALVHDINLYMIHQ